MLFSGLRWRDALRVWRYAKACQVRVRFDCATCHKDVTSPYGTRPLVGHDKADMILQALRHGTKKMREDADDLAGDDMAVVKEALNLGFVALNTDQDSR
jgi:hypothetical protein